MRAPRWFRDFCAWRWAPCVALIAGALIFIVMVLLLVPQQLDTTPRSAEISHPASAAEAPPTRAVVNVLAPAPIAAVTAPDSEERGERVARAPLPAPAAVPPVREPGPVSPPNYAANINDRGDRPTRPALHSSP